MRELINYVRRIIEYWHNTYKGISSTSDHPITRHTNQLYMPYLIFSARREITIFIATITLDATAAGGKQATIYNSRQLLVEISRLSTSRYVPVVFRSNKLYLSLYAHISCNGISRFRSRLGKQTDRALLVYLYIWDARVVNSGAEIRCTCWYCNTAIALAVFDADNLINHFLEYASVILFDLITKCSVGFTNYLVSLQITLVTNQV